MFSDLERSQSWQVQQHQQLQQQQHSYTSEQRQSQSGWFPLQDSSHHPQQQQVLMRTSADNVYAATSEDSLLSQQQQQDVGRWVQVQQQHQPASDPYVHDVGRLVPSRPDPAVYPSQQPQMYSHEIGMAPGVAGGGYATWPQDSRLAGVPVPNGVEDQFQNQFLDRQQQQQQPHGIGGIHSGMAMMASASRQPLGPPLYHHHEGVHNPHPRRRAKEISIGRWNADEHKWFLKGLEMFQGPAWGEIARLIGTRTSTQVRTHAQKFFTKLARMNQTLPYFDAQIQKERARLLAQGTSVTPTATSGGGAFNYALSNLSPRKRVSGANNSPSASGAHMALKRGEYDGGGFVSSSMSSQYGAVSVAISEYQTQARMAGGYDEQVAMGDKMRGSSGVGGGGTAATYYHGSEDSSSADLFKSKYDLSGGMSPLLRKPRMYTDAAGHPVPSSSSSSSSSLALAADPVSEHSDAVYVALPPHQQQQQQQQQHTGYAGLSAHVKDDFDAPRQHYSMVDASQQMSHPHQQHHAYSREPDMGYGMLHADSSVADPATVGATTAAATAYPWDNDDASQQQQRQWLAVPSTSAASSSSHPDTNTSNNNNNSSSSGGSLDAESLPSMNKLLFRGNAVA